MKKIANALGAAALCALAAAPCATLAQDKYPSRPVRIIVPFAPGAATDVLARIAAVELTKRLGQSFVVNNVAGAGGTIGVAQLARAKPDGYTLGVGSPGPITVPPAGRAFPYDPAKDLAAVTLIAAGPAVFVVGKDSHFQSVAQVIAAAKAKPKTINFGSAGIGTSSHLNGELFASLTGVSVTHIPYKGSGPAVTALMAGQIDFMIQYYPAVQPFIKAGTLRAFAISSRERYPISPEIPTMAEVGVPGYEADTWIGLHAPAGTPKAIIDLLQRELAAGLHEPAVTKQLRDSFAVLPGGMPAADFEAYLARERVTMKKLADSTGMTITE